MALLIEKKSSKFSMKLRKKLYILIDEKPLKLDEKTEKKIRGSIINEKPPKLDKKKKKKINYLLLCKR